MLAAGSCWRAAASERRRGGQEGVGARGRQRGNGTADAARVGEGGCSLRAGVGREERGLETGGLITSHTDAVHCRGDSALAYPEAHADIHARLYPRVGEGVRL